MNNKIEMYFSVCFKCLKFDSIADIQDREKYKDAQKMFLNIELNKDLCSNFLFKFCPNEFTYNDTYDFSFVNNENNVSVLLIFNKVSGEIYYVLNLQEIISSILESYNKIVALEKFDSFFDYDFSVRSNYKTDENGAIDEFDIASTESENNEES